MWGKGVVLFIPLLVTLENLRKASWTSSKAPSIDLKVEVYNKQICIGHLSLAWL